MFQGPLRNPKVSQRSNELHLPLDLLEVCQKYLKNLPLSFIVIFAIMIFYCHCDITMANTDHLKKQLPKAVQYFKKTLSSQRTKFRFYITISLRFIFLINLNLILELSLASSFENLERLFQIIIPKVLSTQSLPQNSLLHSSLFYLLKNFVTLLFSCGQTL